MVNFKKRLCHIVNSRGIDAGQVHQCFSNCRHRLSGRPHECYEGWMTYLHISFILLISKCVNEKKKKSIYYQFNVC